MRGFAWIHGSATERSPPAVPDAPIPVRCTLIPNPGFRASKQQRREATKAMDPNNFYDFDDDTKNDLKAALADLEPSRTPWYLRRGLVLAILSILLVVAIAFWALSHRRAASPVLELAEKRQFAAAWAALSDPNSGLSGCARHGLAARLGYLDPNADSILFFTAESLKRCFVSDDSLLRMAALGNLRIAARLPADDSSSRWRHLSAAFGAASRCVGADSTDRTCYLLGDDALAGMADPLTRRNWLDLAARMLPKDDSLATRRQNLPKATDSTR